MFLIKKEKHIFMKIKGKCKGNLFIHVVISILQACSAGVGLSYYRLGLGLGSDRNMWPKQRSNVDIISPGK